MLTRNFYVLPLLFLFMLGCNNPDSTPELRDPVYQDLRSEESKVDKEIQAKEKELLGFKESYAELPDNDYQKKLTRDDIYRTQNEIEKLRQKMSFYKISAESRQIFARKQYLEYYKQGKEKSWPPADSKEMYFKQKALANASKHWDRGVASTKPKKEEKKPSSGH